MLPPVKSQKAVYDVVIVGGGLAGLTAGYLLKDLNILVLEKEAQAGGRILSHSAHGIPYDLGAVFAYNQDNLPFKVNSSALIRESEQIGIFYGGQVHYGSSPIDCLKKLELEPNYLQQLENFQIQPAQEKEGLSDKLYTLINAFFQVIHPGDIWDYLPSLQQDALRKFSTDHYETSNGELIEQFQSNLGSILKLNTKVIEIIDKQTCVKLIIETGDDIDTLWAKTVILTTPAPIALSLLKSIQEPCQSFLQSVQYGRGTVVAIGFKNLELTSFAYLVTPDLPSATIIQHNIQHNSNKVLLVYYVGKVSAQLEAIPNQQIIQQTLGILQQLGIGDISEDKVLFTDVHHWPMVGTIISEDSYGKWKQQLSHPSRRVWLAGDYVFANTEQIIPYGMEAAILSGKQVVKKVKQYLNKEFFAELITKKTPSEQFKSNFLIYTSIYQLSSDKPVFLENKEEGNIAFYGLMLQAHPDKTLQTYLLNQATTEHLWEYQIDYGITADDSALVIEGLMETGVSDQVLMPSLKKLVECFYDSEQGAFRTIRKQGRAVYWQGSSIDATAQVGYLLHRIAPDQFQSEISACTRYLQQNQSEQGYWQSRWFPSVMLTTYYVIRLLWFFPQYQKTLKKTRNYILRTQTDNGSWGNSIIETATAILALQTMNVGASAQTEAKQWILSQKTDQGWRGEPVLYYWYEINPEKKLFFHCMDKGKITTAWATLALNG
ncbi:hypothetical protein BJP34_00875 [Moorena producens PAL-8-15-08-1]|uniref:Amine oxidase domain-containing protein n=1 Tax=Moorena producens PAL-8-15-08-1 TaxID=1458985 RepID=A0A1D8TKS9_9CYAN|nr:FAD-dependent oxidoreductase [Moorena producens]AOW98182.1 hypothetical protein BJP34_00875 [Moorena producens PAL-8-15-08-1]